MHIEQALYGSRDITGYRFLARSPGFRDDWLVEAERLCRGFGERPAGVVCADALFVQPFGKRHVTIVQVADGVPDDNGRPGALAFRVLVLSSAIYSELGGDPFLIADRFPADLSATGNLPALLWSDGPPPSRTVAGLRKVLDVANSAVLLGGTQALLDGGRLVFERRESAGSLVRSLWALLPTTTRCRLWPATIVFAEPSRFHVAVVPRADDPAMAAYVDEVRAGDYPEGRYELELQIAVEHGDQERLDELLARRSRSQVMRLGLALLAVLALGPVAIRFLVPPAAPAAKSPQDTLRLPPANECPSLDKRERIEFSGRLRTIGNWVGATIPTDYSEEDLARGLAILDARLGTPLAQRDPGPLQEFGPLQRQLRVLLWKHGIADYDVPGANTMELLAKLQQKYSPDKRNDIPNRTTGKE
jgi:hypothetical protein